MMMIYAYIYYVYKYINNLGMLKKTSCYHTHTHRQQTDTDNTHTHIQQQHVSSLFYASTEVDIAAFNNAG